MSAAELHLVGPDHKAIAKDVVSGDLVIVDPNKGHITTTARDTIAGLLDIIERDGRRIGSLERQIKEDESADHHPRGKEIKSLIKRWKTATGHTRSKISGDRVKTIKSRLAEGYTVEELELAIDGIAAFPYVGTGGQRFREGKKANRHDRLGIALGGGEAVERFAVLGYEARKRGYVTWDAYYEGANRNAPATRQRPGAGHQE